MVKCLRIADERWARNIALWSCRHAFWCRSDGVEEDSKRIASEQIDAKSRFWHPFRHQDLGMRSFPASFKCFQSEESTQRLEAVIHNSRERRIPFNESSNSTLNGSAAWRLNHDDEFPPIHDFLSLLLQRASRRLLKLMSRESGVRTLTWL